ncbi:hypothetical protein CYLTODRAFT_420315 [Cylindrobasidium torrendii FP15055 ss-10]|uniref:F-box domain-containing protein n=1 Tax=Cylindrobasidium torrendii FP15055 ss-10 TaxID=1314674 RepID=A0A0D7BIG8_9AGAR|nr:hypothetical protein CYLTODRAFT_420315 [Cylindrobasidium torrendii FP15055 ss-10]
MAHLDSASHIRQTLFTTNQVPSEEESKVLNEILLQLDAEQTALPHRLAEIKATVQRWKAIRNPIRYVPDDVLRRIFSYATPWCLADGVEEDSFPPAGLKGTPQTPWTLSYVCQNWRTICLSHRRLWSTFRVSLARLDIPSYARRIDTFYQRSDPLPLRLHIEQPLFSTTSPILLKSAYRWHCVRLSKECRSEYLSICYQRDLLHNRFLPCLTNLSMVLERARVRAVNILAPCLENLELRVSKADYGPDFPWHQIKRYKSCNTDLAYIGRMKNLEEIIVNEDTTSELAGTIGLDVLTTQAIVLPRVRRVEHNNFDNEFGWKVLNLLFARYSFASLRTLVFTDRYSDGVVKKNNLSKISSSDCRRTFVAVWEGQIRQTHPPCHSECAEPPCRW